MTAAVYDSIGVAYAAARRPDPRIATLIDRAVGQATSVLNVGAGTGSYEPHLHRTIALEPSIGMIRQRSADAAPAIRGEAEHLPFVDGCFDVALAILTIHHWRALETGLGELRRVATRIVIFTWDPATAGRLWLSREYFPEFLQRDVARFPPLERLAAALGGSPQVHEVPVPHDCTDGFLGAYWRRPEAYLRKEVRRGISAFRLTAEATVQRGLARLQHDLESGAWHQRHGDLAHLDELDLGYRLITA